MMNVLESSVYQVNICNWVEKKYLLNAERSKSEIKLTPLDFGNNEKINDANNVYNFEKIFYLLDTSFIFWLLRWINRIRMFHRIAILKVFEA